MMDLQGLTQVHSHPNLLEDAQNEDMKTLLNTLGLESQPDPDFFQGDNSVQKKSTTKYSNTKVKTDKCLIHNTCLNTSIPILMLFHF